jgi:hypothetical protein
MSLKVLEKATFHEPGPAGWRERCFQLVEEDGGAKVIERYYEGHGYEPTREEPTWEAVAERAQRAYRAWYEYSRHEIDSLRKALRSAAEERDEVLRVLGKRTWAPPPEDSGAGQAGRRRNAG